MCCAYLCYAHENVTGQLDSLQYEMSELLSILYSPTNFSQEWGQVVERVRFPSSPTRSLEEGNFQTAFPMALAFVRWLRPFYCFSGGGKSHLTRARLPAFPGAIVTVQAALNIEVGSRRFLYLC